MTCIGFIGIENSHITHFTRFLNVEGRHSGARATALVSGEPDRNRELTELGDIDGVVDTPAELVPLVDAAIISTRDGARHLDHARPLLEAGLPVLVDKPLAASVEHAQELLDLAERHSALLLSSSALRFVPEIDAFTAPAAPVGTLRHLHVSGPADPDSEYSGLFFYGIHHVETALEILGNPTVDPGTVHPHVERHGDTVTALLEIDDVTVTFTFVTPSREERTPFHATAIHTAGVVSRDLSLGGDYNAPALGEFVRAIENGRVERSAAHLLSPVAILESITDQLERLA